MMATSSTFRVSKSSNRKHCIIHRAHQAISLTFYLDAQDANNQLLSTVAAFSGHQSPNSFSVQNATLPAASMMQQTLENGHHSAHQQLQNHLHHVNNQSHPPDHLLNQHHQQQHNLVDTEEEPAEEFLPLCDLLFNIISLASYFCDVVFDLVTVYTLFRSEREQFWYFPTLFCVLFSSIISQLLSLRWYARQDPASEKRIDWSKPGKLCVLGTHFFQLGILWRYFRLFVPVNLLTVKHEVRDLCMLRMVHAFCEAAPMLLIQVSQLTTTGSFRLCIHN